MRKPGRPRKNESDTEAVRQKIMDAAETVFAQKGIRGAGLREIASLSGHSLALIRYYFKTKEGLASAIFERHLENHRQVVVGAIQRQKGKPSLKNLAPVLTEIMNWYGTSSGLKAHRMQLSADLDASHELETTAHEYWAQSIGLAGSMLRQLNPKLSEEDSLERALFLLMLMRVRTDLYWIYAKYTRQKKSPTTVIQDYQDWLLGPLLQTLIKKPLK